MGTVMRVDLKNNFVSVYILIAILIVPSTKTKNNRKTSFMRRNLAVVFPQTPRQCLIVST